MIDREFPDDFKNQLNALLRNLLDYILSSDRKTTNLEI